MSFFSLADLTSAHEEYIGSLAGRKRRRGPPPPPQPPQADASVAPDSGAPLAPSDATQPAWWGNAAATFFPPLPTGPAGAASGLGDKYGRLGSTVEYVRPVSGLNEGTFPSSEALEAGGDDMADDSMGEQMVYEGLTGTDADRVPAKIPTDQTDAGGQAITTEVATDGFEFDDGDGAGDELVEPGQKPDTKPQQSHPEIPTFRPGAVNGNGTYNGNGSANKNGTSQNGAQRNGVTGRNRIAAFANGAPLIQGTGAATSRAGAQNNEPGDRTGTAPPNPNGFGLGQAAPVVPASSNPFVDITKTLAQTAGQVGSTAILARRGLTAPQFQPDSGALAPTDQGRGQPSSQSTSYTPWIIGFGVLGVIGVGAWWYFQRKKSADDADSAVTTLAPVAKNPVWRANKKKKTKKKFKKIGC